MLLLETSDDRLLLLLIFIFASQGQTGNGAQFYGSEFQKGESYGERERDREREGGGQGGREMISNFVASTERFCSVNRANTSMKRKPTTFQLRKLRCRKLK